MRTPPQKDWVGQFVYTHPISQAVVFLTLPVATTLISLTAPGEWLIQWFFTTDAPSDAGNMPSEKLVRTMAFFFGLTFSFALHAAWAVIAARSIADQELASFQETFSSRMDEELQKLREAIFPALSKIAKTSSISADCNDAVLLISDLLANKSEAKTIIVRSLIKGFSHRLQTYSSKMDSQGFFMNPPERLELTKELSFQCRSYAIIMTELHYIKSGKTKWNNDYLKKIEDIYNELKAPVSWVFLSGYADSEESIQQALNELPDFAVGYVAKVDAATVLGLNSIRAFKDLGTMIEIFSPEFTNSIANKELRLSSSIPWKATALFLQKHVDAVPTTLNNAVQSCQPSQTIWKCPDIVLLVRAGVSDPANIKFNEALQWICQHAELKKPFIKTKRVARNKNLS